MKPLILPLVIVLLVRSSIAAAISESLADGTARIGASSGQSPNLVFMTSVTGTGNLNSWPEAQALTGLEAGDQICRTVAAAANLPEPSTFVAWLSDDSDDAYCRVHGLTGKVSDDCGQGSIPVDAGPWVRTDGFPFAPTIDRLVSGEILAPIRFDENGNSTSFWHAWTGSTDGGSVSVITCDNWTDPGSGQGTLGYKFGTARAWTLGGSGGCGLTRHLYCFHPGPGADLPPFASPGRIAFVTSDSGTGDLGSWPGIDPGGQDPGLETGDAICRARASAAGLANPNSFVAWLSDDSTAAIDRLVHDGPWVRPDGVLLASNKADLADGDLFTAISVDEFGAYVPLSGAWTGTDEQGLTLVGEHCLGWTSDSGGQIGRRGSSAHANPWWTEYLTTETCQNSLRLYCLEDTQFFLFADGFESGDTAVWSSSVP
jgi:hypothetical protein